MDNNDLQMLEALLAHQQNAIATNQEQTILHENWKHDYVTLRNRLQSLSGKLEQDALLPLGPKAFVPGKIIHTNEVTCLLGDNWFLECSAKHATEIVNRRIEKCDGTLKKLKQEFDQSQAWRLATSQQLGDLMDENVNEIREEYDEEKEKEWRNVHREKVRKYHQDQAKARAEGKGDAEFQTLLSRLDELELQEDEPEYTYKHESRMKPVTKHPQPAAASAVHATKKEPKPKPAVKEVIKENAAVGSSVLEKQSTTPRTAPVKAKRVSKFKKSREEDFEDPE